MIVAALVLPDTSVGIAEQSITRRPAMPCTRKRASTIVIGTGLINFNIYSSLKSWIDHVARAGLTFKYTENGPQGLLSGKRAFVLTARGGIYAGSAMDHQEPYLRQALAFIGIHDVSFIHAEGLNLGGEFMEKGLSEAKGQIAQVI